MSLIKEVFLLPFFPFRLAWRWTEGLVLQSNARSVIHSRGGGYGRTTTFEQQPVKAFIGGRALTALGIAVVLYAVTGMAIALLCFLLSSGSESNPVRQPPSSFPSPRLDLDSPDWPGF